MFEKQMLFRSGESGYATFRIPAVLATASGTLLAFAAARRDFGDWSDMDIAMRRSEDSGVSWEEMQIVAASSSPQPTDNPVPIYDRMTGEVHFLFQRNYERVFYMKSSDEGKTFSAPRDITPAVEEFRREYAWQVIAPGPGHGLQMSSGRLLVPVWMSTGEGTEFGGGRKGHRPSEVSVIYSDDHGATWRPGAMAVRNTPKVVNPSETTLEELADGRVMLNVRSESSKYRRVIVTSPTGVDGWSAPEFQEDLYEPICFGSMIRVSSDPSNILFVNPDSSAKTETIWKSKMANAADARLRENLTIRLSTDEGKSWPISRVIDPGVAGYSDLAVAPDGTVLCLYEHGGRAAQNAGMSVARFDLEWVQKGAG